MGNAIAQVKCHPGMDSPTAPGFKSILSDPLDEYCSAETFYDALWSLLKTPFGQMETFVLKEHKVEDLGEEEFHVKVTYDGVKLKHFGLQKNDEDKSKVNQHIWGNRKEQTILSQNMDIDGKLVNTGNVKMLTDPVRVEYWMIEDGERKADKEIAWILTNLYIAPILRALATRKVKVLPSHQSELDGGGQSVISEPLDEWLTYDMAWDFYIDGLKHPYTFPGLPAPKLIESEDGSWELTLPEPEVLRELNLAKDSSLPSRDFHHAGRCDKEASQIVVVSSVGQELLCTSFSVFHRSPLRIESWQVVDGKREGGTMHASALQEVVDRIIEKSQGKEGYYF